MRQVEIMILFTNAENLKVGTHLHINYNQNECFRRENVEHIFFKYIFLKF